MNGRFFLNVVSGGLVRNGLKLKVGKEKNAWKQGLKISVQ